MKIIKKGSIPEPKKPLWQRIIITCKKCDAEFQLEEGDKFLYISQYWSEEANMIICSCPTCGVDLKIDC